MEALLKNRTKDKNDRRDSPLYNATTPARGGNISSSWQMGIKVFVHVFWLNQENLCPNTFVWNITFILRSIATGLLLLLKFKKVEPTRAMI